MDAVAVIIVVGVVFAGVAMAIKHAAMKRVRQKAKIDLMDETVSAEDLARKLRIDARRRWRDD